MNIQEVINAVTEQRNSALNELALAKAELIVLKSKITELENKLSAEILENGMEVQNDHP